MKKSLALCFASLLAAALASADDLTGRVGVGGTIGAAVPSGSQWVRANNGAGYGLGGWARFGLSPRWSAGLAYDNLGFTSGPTRLEFMTLSGAFAVDPESVWNPNLHAGLGSAFAGNVEYGKPTEFGLVLGFGFDRFVTDHVSVGGAFDWFDAPKNEAPYHDANAVRIGLTAGWWFGGRNAPVKTAAAPAPVPAPAPEPAPAPVKVTIALDVQFDTAQSVVKPEYDGQLKKVADFLAQHGFSTAEIEGHTDTVGSAEYNRGLSQRRAEAVRQALIDRFGVDEARLTAKGYGPDKPIAGNDTAEGRAKNRRVVATFSAVGQ